jgi:hypothetical protein
MQAVSRVSYCVLAVSLLSACAGSPARVSAPPAPSANPGGPSAAKQPPDAAHSPSEVDDVMRKRGYKPALYRGERVYCRNQAITGSNLETKVCLTARQIEDQERSGKDMLTGPHPDGCGPQTKGCL